MERALGERSHRIRYEDLVTEPERELRALADFLGVAFEPGLLEGASDLPLTPGERRHEHHTNVSKPIDASSAGRWRGKLSDEEDAAILHLCGGVMRDLGYEVGEGRPASAAMQREARRAPRLEFWKQNSLYHGLRSHRVSAVNPTSHHTYGNNYLKILFSLC